MVILQVEGVKSELDTLEEKIRQPSEVFWRIQRIANRDIEKVLNRICKAYI